jgi:NAD(P)-dependent dehydrogenase (short-subunit alcohol dehydrogenase family)
MKDLAGKVAVVTGAASGIGRALAERFAAEKMRVVLADVEERALAEAEETLRATGAAVVAVPTDVSKASDVEALARRALDAFGGAHVLCNNAGVVAAGVLWELPLADWEWILGVNLWGVIHGLRTFVPLMLRQDTACHIVNTASMAGLVSGPLNSIYNVTKHGVVTLSETLHHELRMWNAKINVSVLCPGWVNTRIIDAERNRPAALQRPPAAREQSPTEQLMEQAARQFLASGLPPAQVAELVLEAIRNERFYVLTHPEWKGLIRARMNDILEERPPSLTTFE